MDDDSFVEAVLTDSKEKMAKAISHSREDFASVRTGRASPALIEKLRVDYYGTDVPLQQIAGISVPEAKLMVVTPYDKNALRGSRRPSRHPTWASTPATTGPSSGSCSRR